MQGPPGANGAKGDKGDPGDVGGSLPWANITDKPDKFKPVDYTHNQSTPSALWIINHNQGFKPTFVSVMDTGGSGVNCGISHPSINQTVLSFNPPMAGVARLL